MKKRFLSRTVLVSLAAVLFAGALFAACDSGSSPTAPEPASAASLPTGSSSSDQAATNLDLSEDANVASDPVTEKAKGPKVDVCHQQGNGSYQIINVAASAVPAHEGHGDWVVGPEVCDGVDNDCNGTVDDGGNALCDDAVGCTVDVCNGASGCENTPDDAACDDGLYCNGAETCDAVNDCQAGAPPDCSDGVVCTDDSCNEATDSCDHVPNDANCDNGLFCDGAETCDGGFGCQAGTDPCPGETCDEVGDMCTPAGCAACQVTCSAVLHSDNSCCSGWRNGFTGGGGFCCKPPPNCSGCTTPCP